jgi:EspG family
MTTALSPDFTLTDDELLVIGARVGIQTFPTVLGVRPRYGTVDALDAALDAATGDLAARGLIADGAVEPDLIPLLQALQRPNRELAMRLVTPDGMARVSCVRRGGLQVVARRLGDQITLRVIDDPPGLAGISRALINELPQSAAAQFVPVPAPLDAVSRYLVGTHDPRQLADRVRALGAEARSAMVLGSALASRVAFAEIVYYALADDEDRILRQPAAVGVFYTKQGRIVGSPSVSPSGQLWTTLKPGSDHVLGQAIGQLVEVSTGRWEGP